MRELSLHILDIVQNSIRAKATEVQIKIEILTEQDELIIQILDNGEGMSQEMVKAVVDPFVTTRTTRRVGLGIPLFKAAAERSDGELILQSNEGEGTLIKASFKFSHIDRTPLGDIILTIVTLIQGNPEIDFEYTHQFDDKMYQLSTKFIRQEVSGVPVNHPLILEFIGNDMLEGLQEMMVD